MSNTAIALALGTTVLVVGGTVAYFAMQKKKEADAPVVAQAGGAGVPDVAGPAQRMSVGEALAILGGKAVQEGIKYATMGQAGYAASLAGRAQKSA